MEVNFENVIAIMQKANKPLIGWQVYQGFDKSERNLSNVHATLCKLFKYGMATRTRIHAKKITGRDQTVFCYKLVKKK